MKRHAGSRSPSTRTLNCVVREAELVDAPSPRHSGGMSRSGSSFIGHGKRSSLVPSMPVLVEVHPVEGVERALGRARVVPRCPCLSRRAMVRLRGADRAVQQDDALLGAVALRPRS